MIVYGVKSKEIISENLSEKCPNCGAENSVQLHVFQKYAHVFGLPSFPTGKTGQSVCSVCNQVLTVNEMPDSFKEEYKNLKARRKTPVYFYSGLIVLIAIILIGISYSKKSGNDFIDLIASPQKGDVYEILGSNRQYTLFKVKEVVGDTVYFLENQFESNNRVGLKEIEQRGDTAYMPEVKAFSKTQLINALNKRRILNIKRK